MTEKWPKVRIGEVLRQRRPDVVVVPSDLYQFAGVYSFGRGVFRGQVRRGNEFSYKKLMRLRSKEFVYPKLMAWEGAFGVVPPNCDGCYVSPEFPVFEIDTTRLSPRFLELYFRLPRVWLSISGGSTGTNVRRRRLNPADFLKRDIPLPPMAEQQALVALIDEVASKISEVLILRQDAAAEREALCRSLLSHDAKATPTPMRELIKLRDPDVIVQADASYQFAGVYSFGRGVFKSIRKSGTEFAYSRLTRLRAGDFVYPKLMAWEGALGVVPQECDGCVVSTEFPVFEVMDNKVLPEVLDTHFRNPAVWPVISGASTGTNVRRRRLNPRDFLNYEMPLPSRETQFLLRQVRAKLDSQKRLQDETDAELDALLSSVLNQTFNGGL